MTEKSVFFSIIIPTYNRPESLLRALNSIFSQTFTDYEVLIVNDGSSADYAAIEKMSAASNQLDYFRKENAGVSAARNYGIERAAGSFICFLDDDDYYLPTHLEVLFNLIESKNRIQGLYRTFSKLLNGNKEENQVITHLEDQNNRITYVLQNLMLTINIALSRETLQLNKFNEKIKFAEDTDLWIRILLDYPLFEAFDHTTVYDRTNESASTGSMKIFLAYIDSFELIFSNPRLNELVPDEFKKEKYKKYFSWIIAELALKKEVFAYFKMRKRIIRLTGLNFFLRNLVKVTFQNRFK